VKKGNEYTELCCTASGKGIGCIAELKKGTSEKKK